MIIICIVMSLLLADFYEQEMLKGLVFDFSFFLILFSGFLGTVIAAILTIRKRAPEKIVYFWCITAPLLVLLAAGSLLDFVQPSFSLLPWLYFSVPLSFITGTLLAFKAMYGESFYLSRFGKNR